MILPGGGRGDLRPAIAAGEYRGGDDGMYLLFHDIVPVVFKIELIATSHYTTIDIENRPGDPGCLV